MKTQVTRTPLEGLVIVNIDYYKDERGFFIESWNRKNFREAGIPDDFAFSLLPEDWEHFRVLLEQGCLRIPGLASAPVRQHVNGPESFTPDGRYMLGEAPESFYGQSAHDQGYLNAAGISTANFGSGEQAFAHTDLDMASVDKTFDAAKVYAWMIASYLGK